MYRTSTRTHISWTVETVENVVPPLSMSKTEITKVPLQYSSVIVWVDMII